MASLEDTIKQLTPPAAQELVRNILLPAARQLQYSIATQSTSPQVLEESYGVLRQAYYKLNVEYLTQIGKAENREAVEALWRNVLKVVDPLQGVYRVVSMVQEDPEIKDPALEILERELSKLVEKFNTTFI